MEDQGKYQVDGNPDQPSKPVAWQFYQDGKWWNGDDRIKDHRKNTEEAGFPIRDLIVLPTPQQCAPVVDQRTSDYRLVPVDLLSELAESLACELDARYPASVRSYEAQDRKYQAEMEPVLTARQIIAAAPAVQGEPVARVKTVGGYPDGSEHVVEWLCKHKDLKDGDYLYLVQQPTEQQREPCHECGGNGAGGEHEEDCSQQVAPDVAQLVEALERISKRASAAECKQVPCSPIQRLFVDIMQQADDALAAHRKGTEA